MSELVGVGVGASQLGSSKQSAEEYVCASIGWYGTISRSHCTFNTQVKFKLKYNWIQYINIRILIFNIYINIVFKFM